MTKTDFGQDAMSVARDITEKFNRRDFTGIIEDGDGAVDYTEVGTGRRVTDPDEMIALMQGWTTAIPDLRGTVLSAMRDGDRLCVELHWEGTHRGPLETPAGTVPASGNHVSTRAVELHTIRDGRIVDWTHYLDMMTFMTQISGSAAVTASGEKKSSSPA